MSLFLCLHNLYLISQSPIVSLFCFHNLFLISQTPIVSLFCLHNIFLAYSPVWYSRYLYPCNFVKLSQWAAFRRNSFMTHSHVHCSVFLLQLIWVGFLRPRQRESERSKGYVVLLLPILGGYETLKYYVYIQSTSVLQFSHISTDSLLPQHTHPPLASADSGNIGNFLRWLTVAWDSSFLYGSCNELASITTSQSTNWFSWFSNMSADPPSRQMIMHKDHSLLILLTA